MLIIGSVALINQIEPSVVGRVPVDIDIVGTWDELEEVLLGLDEEKDICYPESKDKYIIKKTDVDGRVESIIEWEIAWPNSSAQKLLDLYPEDTFAPPQALYALKMSHRYLKNSPHFLKTMSDIQMMRENFGFEHNIHDHCKEFGLTDFYNLREEETYDYHHPNLNRSKDDFFADDLITYFYDHDSIHEAVAIGDRPAYESFKVPGAEVAVDMDVFFELDEQIRLNAVMEESMVLCLERSLIPFHYEEYDNKTALERQEVMVNYALMKVCTSITSGRFREYAWENYDKASTTLGKMIANGDGPANKFTMGVAFGIVKRLEPTKEDLDVRFSSA